MTDGGFPLQVRAISELFDATKVLVPSEKAPNSAAGLSPLGGHRMQIVPLSAPKGSGLHRKLDIPFWLARNGRIIWREIKNADAVHAPVPGDVGTIGMIFALLLKKPLFVRHCGNWLIQRTIAEHFWKWSMEFFAGGRNVMLATGGTERAPSKKNSNIKWIFSTSLKQENIEKAVTRAYPENGKIKLITACRLEDRKGVDVVIESLPSILKVFPNAHLDIVGGGALESKLKQQAARSGIERYVKFHGKEEQAKVLELMRQAHVFCFPTSASEGFPKVVIEALASGLPVITTKVSVLPQLVGSGGGILIDAATSENVAAAVENVFADAGKYQQMSAKAIETARCYSLESWRDFIGDCLRRSWNVPSLSSG